MKKKLVLTHSGRFKARRNLIKTLHTIAKKRETSAPASTHENHYWTTLLPHSQQTRYTFRFRNRRNATDNVCECVGRMANVSIIFSRKWIHPFMVRVQAFSFPSFVQSKLITIIIIILISFFPRSPTDFRAGVQRQKKSCALSVHRCSTQTHTSPSARTIHFCSTLPFVRRQKEIGNSYFACFNPIKLLSETNKIHNGEQHTVVGRMPQYNTNAEWTKQRKSPKK